MASTREWDRECEVACGGGHLKVIDDICIGSVQRRVTSKNRIPVYADRMIATVNSPGKLVRFCLFSDAGVEVEYRIGVSDAK